jgi:hypothetical protein
LGAFAERTEMPARDGFQAGRQEIMSLSQRDAEKIVYMNPAELVMPSVAPTFRDVRLRAFEHRDV